MTIALILLSVHFHSVGGKKKLNGALQIVVALAENLRRLSRVRTTPHLTIDVIRKSERPHFNLVATDSHRIQCKPFHIQLGGGRLDSNQIDYFPGAF